MSGINLKSRQESKQAYFLLMAEVDDICLCSLLVDIQWCQPTKKWQRNTKKCEMLYFADWCMPWCDSTACECRARIAHVESTFTSYWWNANITYTAWSNQSSAFHLNSLTWCAIGDGWVIFVDVLLMMPCEVTRISRISKLTSSGTWGCLAACLSAGLLKLGSLMNIRPWCLLSA